MTEQHTDTIPDGRAGEAPTVRRPLTAVPSTVAGGHALHVGALLDTLVERRSTVDRAEADTLALVAELADACPAADADTGEHGPRLVAEETAVVDLAARLGISYRAALALVTETVELRDRLPRLWALVQQGRLQAWKARQVARATTLLPDPVVAFVDAHTAVTAHRNQLPDLRKLLLVAVNRCDPDLAEGLEEAARDHREVVFDFSASTDHAATATLQATLDLLDALDLDATVTDLAATMDRLGDHSHLGVRRARALGSLAHPQRTLDLFGDPVATTHHADLEGTTDADGHDAGGGADPAGAADASAVLRPRRRAPWDGQREWNSQVGNLYLHLDATDLRELLAQGLPGQDQSSGKDAMASETSGTSGAGGVDLERLGAASLRLVQVWLGRVTRVSVRPVLDLGASHPVDHHDPPPALRDQVILRDGRCVFPGCAVHARACDQDHIDPYIPMDHGGPPDQTRPENLACLCRRHHRMKTHHGWHYHRAPDGTYEWTDPRGTRYTTAPRPLHLHRAA